MGPQRARLRGTLRPTRRGGRTRLDALVVRAGARGAAGPASSAARRRSSPDASGAGSASTGNQRTSSLSWLTAVGVEGPPSRRSRRPSARRRRTRRAGRAGRGRPRRPSSSSPAIPDSSRASRRAAPARSWSCGSRCPPNCTQKRPLRCRQSSTSDRSGENTKHDAVRCSGPSVRSIAASSEARTNVVNRSRSGDGASVSAARASAGRIRRSWHVRLCSGAPGRAAGATMWSSYDSGNVVLSRGSLGGAAGATSWSSYDSGGVVRADDRTVRTARAPRRRRCPTTRAAAPGRATRRPR